MNLIEIRSQNGAKYSVPVVNIAFVTHPSERAHDNGGVTLVSGEFIAFENPSQVTEIVKLINRAYEDEGLSCS